MKIAIIGQKGLPLGADAGGVERHVEELGARLAGHGHVVIVYVRPRYATEAEREYRGMKLVRTWSFQTRYFDTLTHSISATLDAARRGANIIHYHGVGPATVAWLARLLAPRARVIVTFHSIDRLHQKWGFIARAYLRFGEWAALHFPHATIVVSHSIQEYCQRVYGRDTIRIPNGSIIPDYPGSDRLGKWGIKPDSYILTVARLVRQKGIHHLIKAFDGFELEKKLVIVGAADAHTEYAEEIRKLSEGNTAIVFAGFQHGVELAQLYANAYLYVQPSEAEGLAVSILEAMAAARCVLVSDIPANVESIDHSGLTFVNADVEDLRVQLRKLINHPEIVTERGRKGREHVRFNYDWDRITERTEAVYEAAF